MNIEDFKQEAYRILEELTDLVNANVESTGDTSDTCQQLTIINEIYGVEYAINGTTQKDLK